jgi:hypothetical protein
MSKIVTAFYFLAVVAALTLVKPAGIIAQPNRSDLEERLARLEVEGTINRQHIQNLESHVRDLEANAETSGKSQNTSDLEASVSWIRHVYIPSSMDDIDRLDKRVKGLERDHFLEYVCAKPTAKQRADSIQVALSKQRAALCLAVRAQRD